MNKYTFKRDNIKAAMTKQIAKLWADEGKGAVNVSALDPLVHHLVGALAIELEKVGNEVHNAQGQVLKNLAQLMLPDVFTHPLPAHAIAHARSYSSTYRLKKQEQFYYTKTLVNKQQEEIQEDYFFSPLKSTEIIDGNINYLVSSQNINLLNSFGQKEIVGQSKQKNTQHTHTLWLGIELNEDIINLPAFNFYFDWENIPLREKETYLQLLSMLKCRINGDAIAIQQGFAPRIANNENAITAEFDNLQNIENHILEFYEKQFVRINKQEAKAILVADVVCNYPKIWEQFYTAEALQNFKTPLLWIELEFPQFISPKVLEDLSCHLNCFPVINRQWHEQSHHLHLSLNILPLRNNNQFLAIDSIYNENGAAYQYQPFNNIKNQKAQTYTIRKNNVERFDKRNGKAFLNYLLELLRDESAAFTALGRDVLYTRMEDLKRIITSIENDLAKNAGKENPPTYLVLNAKHIRQNLKVKYWTTDGIHANKIPKGTVLDIYTEADVKRDSLRLMSTSTSGRNALSDTDRLYAYQSTLLSHSRMLTMQDVKAFCKAELGQHLSKVTVKKGVAIDPHPQNGFKRTIDVLLYPTANNHFTENEWLEVCKNLAIKLKERSSLTYPYRVMMAG